MQPAKNPNQKAIMISALLLALSAVSVTLGLTLFSGDAEFWTVAMGGLAAFIALFLLLVFMWDGKRKARAIEALLRGDGVYAHWKYSQDEWDRYSRNELDRAVADAKKTSLYAFIVVLGMGLASGLIGRMAIDGLFLVILLAAALGITLLVGGTMLTSARMTFRANSAGVGEAYISRTGLYFQGQYHSWANRGSRLTAVQFGPGDPATVNFHYEVIGGENTQHIVARVPVPRGCEAAAQSVVSRFYESEEPAQ